MLLKALVAVAAFLACSYSGVAIEHDSVDFLQVEANAPRVRPRHRRHRNQRHRDPVIQEAGEEEDADDRAEDDEERDADDVLAQEPEDKPEEPAEPAKDVLAQKPEDKPEAPAEPAKDVLVQKAEVTPELPAEPAVELDRDEAKPAVELDRDEEEEGESDMAAEISAEEFGASHVFYLAWDPEKGEQMNIDEAKVPPEVRAATEKARADTAKRNKKKKEQAQQKKELAENLAKASNAVDAGKHAPVTLDSKDRAPCEPSADDPCTADGETSAQATSVPERAKEDTAAASSADDLMPANPVAEDDAADDTATALHLHESGTPDVPEPKEKQKGSNVHKKVKSTPRHIDKKEEVQGKEEKTDPNEEEVGDKAEPATPESQADWDYKRADGDYETDEECVGPFC